MNIKYVDIYEVLRILLENSKIFVLSIVIMIIIINYAVFLYSTLSLCIRKPTSNRMQLNHYEIYHGIVAVSHLQ